MGHSSILCLIEWHCHPSIFPTQKLGVTFVSSSSLTPISCHFLHPRYFLNMCTLFFLLHHSLLKMEFPLPIVWTTTVAPVVFLPHPFLPSSKWATKLWITTVSLFPVLLPLHSSHTDPLSVSPTLMFPLIMPHSSSLMPFPLPERLFPPWCTSLGLTHPSDQCLSLITSRSPPVTSLTSLYLPSYDRVVTYSTCHRWSCICLWLLSLLCISPH